MDSTLSLTIPKALHIPKPPGLMSPIPKELSVRAMIRERALPLLTMIIESGNMLIMSLAHARASGDGTLLSRHVGAAAIPIVGLVLIAF